MSTINSTILRKGETMKRSRFPEYNKYVIIYGWGSNVSVLVYDNVRAAVNAYREAKKVYKDTIRMAKVVLDYGDDI